MSAAIGALSIGVALIVPPRQIGLAGMVYFLLGPAHGLDTWKYLKRRSELAASAEVGPDPAYAGEPPGA